MLALFSRFRRPGWNWCCGGGEPAGAGPRGPACPLGALGGPSAKWKKAPPRPPPARPSDALLEDEEEQPGLSVPDSALDEEEDDDEEDTVTRLGPDDTLPGPELSAEPDGPLSVNVFTSAEELERAQRLEERERILREIWRTGQPDLLGTGTLGPSPTGTGTLGRMHYY